MQFTVKLDKMDSPVWGHHITLPKQVSDHFLSKKIKRVVCVINDIITIHSGIQSKGDGQFFILVNKEIRKKLALIEGDELTIELTEDKSKYGMPMPEEMGELLEIDDEANQFFHSLTKGKQRSLIYMISKPKSSDVRLKKALTICDYLKTTGGKLDYKDLNEAFKQSNY